MKAVVAIFNQEKALVGARDYESSDGTFSGGHGNEGAGVAPLCCTLVVMLEPGQEQEFISAKTDPG